MVEVAEVHENITPCPNLVDKNQVMVVENMALNNMVKNQKPAKSISDEFSGKRIKRGFYQTARGWLVNADTQAAANCLRKVATQLGFNLAKVGKEVLTLPQRYDLDSLSRSYRKRAEAWIDPA